MNIKVAAVYAIVKVLLVELELPVIFGQTASAIPTVGVVVVLYQ